MIDLPMEVLGVLRRQAEPTVHEIAHDIDIHHRRRFTAEEIGEAIVDLDFLGYEIRAHDDPDGIRYELTKERAA